MGDWDVTWFEEPVSSDDLCAAAPDVRHIEFFHDHARMLFDTPPVPRDGSLRPAPSRPGFGVERKPAAAGQFRVA